MKTRGIFYLMAGTLGAIVGCASPKPPAELQNARTAFSAARQDQVCWVPLWRHATDTMTVQWLTNEVCTVAFTMQTQPWVADDSEDSNSDSGSGT
jgi:hypothetical protein